MVGKVRSLKTLWEKGKLVENIVGKEENNGKQHFLLLPQFSFIQSITNRVVYVTFKFFVCECFYCEQVKNFVV